MGGAAAALAGGAETGLIVSRRLADYSGVTPAKKRQPVSGLLGSPRSGPSAGGTGAATAAAEAASILAAQVDELGALEAELAPLKPRIARAEALRAALRARFEGSPPDAACEARGRRFIAALGPKATERTVDVAKLAKLCGTKVLYTVAKVSLKALGGLVHPEWEPLLVTSAPTGARPLKLFELGKAA